MARARPRRNLRKNHTLRSERLLQTLARSGKVQRRFAGRLGPPSPAHPEPARPGGSTRASEATPGVSRFQRQSANLPSGVARFRGLGEETEIVVDLTAEDAEDQAAEDRAAVESG